MTNFSLSSSLNFLTSESETAAHQEPPAKWSCTPSGSQHGGEEPSRPEEHAAQPERSTSPQPSTSGSLHYPPEPHISLIPPPYTSESDSDSDYYSDSGVEGDVDTDSDSDFQDERSSSPPRSNSAQQARTSRQISTPGEKEQSQGGDGSEASSRDKDVGSLQMFRGS
ncbi:clumping factor B-like isoform X2 [Acanthochromis polyacanthus]|uniref:clumping factor B-like isoform X2 n=1 Tax=Acanthochromis polyacanthus TaxID=80966 RepID=UPI002234CC1D|nr:clumping factor B-like isoform X2 [Acanthochromis polyacanthus]